MKQFDTGYWILLDIPDILEGGNQQIIKYFMDKSGVCFAGGRTPLTFIIFVLAGRGVLSDFCWVLAGRVIDLFYNFGRVPDQDGLFALILWYVAKTFFRS